MNISDLIKESHDTAVEKGWWADEVLEIRCASCNGTGEASGFFSDIPFGDCSKCTGLGYTTRTVERSFGDQIALMHSELSEALEEFRKGEKFTDIYVKPDGVERKVYFDEGMAFEYWKDEKPEGIAVELADVLIRIADTCGRYNIPLEEALKLKLTYNKTRPHRHGGKKL